MERSHCNVWSVIEKRAEIFAPTMSWDNSMSDIVSILTLAMCALMGFIVYRHIKWIYVHKSCSKDKKDKIWMSKF
jgi:hypothetical protein